MKKIFGLLVGIIFAAGHLAAQAPELKFIADTVVVQADGTYEADPDLATLTFQIFSQDKEIKKAAFNALSKFNKPNELRRIFYESPVLE